MIKFDGYEYDALSVEVWNDNYKQYDETSREQTWDRIAKCCAKIENEEIRDKITEDFKSILYNDKFVPGGRIMSNIGNEDRKGTTLFNCYVHNPHDIHLSDCDSIDGIYKMLWSQAKTLQAEGGYGTNFSWIRPAGSYIAGIGSRTPGPIKFMELWDKSSEIITVGSSKIRGERKNSEKTKIRKGAMMVVLNVWHPDIKEFITVKQTPGLLTKFNMSVGITEGFMNAVINDLDWELKYPDTSIPEYKTEWFGFIEDWETKGYPVIVYEKVKAKEIWELIMQSTYNRAEPGVLFLDTYNRLNPLQYAEKIAATNPCQPSWAKVLTPMGIKEIKDVNIGDLIWSSEGWTKIVNKWSTGVKDVYKASTNIGNFYSTENHRILSNGLKVELKDAKTIDMCISPNVDSISINLQDVMDGLVFGDGSVHKASNDLVYFIVGEKDYDYFNDNIKDYFIKSRPGIKPGSYEVKTTITSNELPKTFERKIPERFLKGDSSKVAGFLRGLFSANGSISGQRVTLKASSFFVIEDVITMLSSLGIRSYYTTNKSKSQKFKNGIYTMKESYDINITSDRKKFRDLIGFIQNYKNDSLNKLIDSIGVSCKGNKKSYEIKSYEKFSVEEVFDLTVDNKSHTYWSFGFDISNCGEVGMSTGVCNLGSLNLTQFIKDVDGKLEFDFVDFSNSVSIAIRFLDNINSISTTPLQEYDKSVLERRRIGLGVMGLGSMHLMLGIPFGSQESLKLQDKIARVKCETELLTSAKLGKEKGSFKLFDREKYFNSEYFKTIDISEDIKSEIMNIGEMRNSHQSMNAPTGNTGIFARNVSGGIEPVFSINGYYRWCIVPESRQRELINLGMRFPNVHKGEWFETDLFKFSTRGNEQILKGSFLNNNYEIDKSRGLTIQNYVEDFGIKFAKSYYKDRFEEMKSKDLFKDVSNLDVDDHVNSLKIWAKYCNMSISKTVNLPNDYSYEKFQTVYMDAWKNNIKGITTYREGTMTAVLETKDNKSIISNESIKYSDAPKRPKKLECDIHQVKIKGESWTIFVGKLDGLPYEIFGGSEKYIKIPKVYTKGILEKDSKKKDKNSQYNLYYGEDGKETIIKDIVSVFENPLYNYHTRSLSMKLRHGISPMFIVEMLQRDELGSELYSFNKVIARVLKTYIKDGTKKKGTCPNCGGENLIMQEGCFVCQDCSHSKCS